MFGLLWLKRFEGGHHPRLHGPQHQHCHGSVVRYAFPMPETGLGWHGSIHRYPDGSYLSQEDLGPEALHPHHAIGRLDSIAAAWRVYGDVVRSLFGRPQRSQPGFPARNLRGNHERL